MSSDCKLSLRFNGPIAVVNSKGQNCTPSSEKGKAILLLLATGGINGRARGWIQSKLWPNAASGANLRNELSVLRRHFSKFEIEPLISNKRTVMLDFDVCDLDLDHPIDDIRRLELAEGLDVGVVEFEEWLATERSAWDSDKIKNASQLVHLAGFTQERFPTIYLENCEGESRNDPASRLIQCVINEIIEKSKLFSDRMSVVEAKPARPFTDKFSIYISSHGDSKITLTVRLVSLFSNRIPWSDRFATSTSARFYEQQKISRTIIDGIQSSLFDGYWAELWAKQEIPDRAWEAYQKGRAYEANFTLEGNLRAIEEYRTSLTLAPELYPALVAIGFCLADQIRLGWTDAEDRNLDEIRSIVAEALSFDPNNPYAHALEAFRIFLSGQKSQGIRYLENVLLSAKKSPELLAYMGAMYGHNGQLDEEIKVYSNALKLTDYPPPWIPSNLAIAQATKLDKAALVTANHAIQLAPNSVRARIAKICILVEVGRVTEAKGLALEIKRIDPFFDADSWSQINSFTNLDHHRSIAQKLAAAGL